eukprot:COSAG02_NODE_2527_length_8604_cov_4.945209_6_plen_113_part_00
MAEELAGSSVRHHEYGEGKIYDCVHHFSTPTTAGPFAWVSGPDVSPWGNLRILHSGIRVSYRFHPATRTARPQELADYNLRLRESETDAGQRTTLCSDADRVQTSEHRVVRC